MTCVAFSIKFAKTNQKLAENSEFCEKKFTIIVNYSLHSLGPKSIKLFEQRIKKAKTVVWNGPAGVFEFENFSKGTYALLNAVAKLHKSGGRGIIGGGDSATAAANAGMEDKVSWAANKSFENSKFKFKIPESSNFRTF